MAQKTPTAPVAPQKSATAPANATPANAMKTTAGEEPTAKRSLANVPLITADDFAALKAKPKAERTDDEVDRMKVYRRSLKAAGRTEHPGVGAKDNYPFDSIPSDYDFTKFKPLGKKNFKDSTGFMEYRSAQLKYRGQKLIDIGEKLAGKAKIDRQFGNDDTRKKARKFSDMMSEIEMLKAQLAAQGVDITSLMLKPKAPDAPAALVSETLAEIAAPVEVVQGSTTETQPA